MIGEFKTNNEFGTGVVKSWASILDDNTREAAEVVSRSPVVDGHVALMPDAHFGYGPPVGTALRTRDAVIPYSVGVDIGCGMMAVQLNLDRANFAGKEGALMAAIREAIPSGVGKAHPTRRPPGWEEFVKEHGWPPGVDNVHVLAAAMQRRHDSEGQVRDELMAKARAQFGTLGAGNHFVEVCEAADGGVWLVLHSGSRGVGNVLATAHANLAKSYCAACRDVELESVDLSFLRHGTEEFNAYIADMLWAQEYAMANREAMMRALAGAVQNNVSGAARGLLTINCHHNYAEEVEENVWQTRKGAINAEKGRMGIIPGSMGAATYIVRGLGCEEALNTAPHGAGRVMSRGRARRELDLDMFKASMSGKTWLDRDAERLLDESPEAYKPIGAVMEDSRDLVETVAVLSQFVNYKGV